MHARERWQFLFTELDCNQQALKPTACFSQEIERYNALLDLIRQQLTDLERGVQGLVVMSTELEQVFYCILNGQVPPAWQKVEDLLRGGNADQMFVGQSRETLA